jgi:hypothetical protein
VELAGVMKQDPGKTLSKLVRRERHRLWQERVLHYLPWVLWGCASALLAAGYLHQSTLPLKASLVLGSIMLPALLCVVVIALRQKPSMDEGAAEVDRLLGANSLFVSSWELYRLPDSPQGVGTLLLARASASLPAWREQILRRKPTTPTAPANLIALSLGLIGGFFLMLPSSVVTAHSPAQPTVSNNASSNQPQQPAELLSDLFRHKANPVQTVSGPTRQDSRQGTGSEPSPQPGNSAQEANGEFNIAQPPTSNLQVKNSSGSTPVDTKKPPDHTARHDGSKIASNTPGDDNADTADSPAIAGDAFDQVTPMAIETGTDTQSTAQDTSHEGNVLIASRPQSRTLHSTGDHAMRDIGHIGSGSRLNPEQRIRVERYFNQLVMSK